MEDMLVLVDLFDRELGYEEKMNVHKQKLLHRAFSVFLIYNGKMLLQRRANTKYHSGGLWANACCSHPRKGERMDFSVKRRLKEELGIACEVKKLFEFVYYSDYGTLAEYEYDHVFLGEYYGEIVPNPTEIHELEWVEFTQLKNDLENNPQKYASWFLVAAPKVLAAILKMDTINKEGRDNR